MSLIKHVYSAQLDKHMYRAPYIKHVNIPYIKSTYVQHCMDKLAHLSFQVICGELFFVLT